MRHRSFALLTFTAFGCGGVTLIDSSPIDGGSENRCTGDCPDTGLRSDATLPPSSPRDAGVPTDSSATEAAAIDALPADASAQDATDTCTVKQFACGGIFNCQIPRDYCETYNVDLDAHVGVYSCPDVPADCGCTPSCDCVAPQARSNCQGTFSCTEDGGIVVTSCQLDR